MFEVREHYENGAGGYSTRIRGVFKKAGRAPAERDDNRDAEQGPGPLHVTLNKECLLGPSTSQPGTSSPHNQEGTSTSEDQSLPVKRPRLINPLLSATSTQRNSGSVHDEKTGPAEHVQASDEAKPDDYLAQLVSRLDARLKADRRMRERARRLRRKELAKMCHKPSTTSVQRNSASVTDEKTGPTKRVSASGDTKPDDYLAELVSRLDARLKADKRMRERARRLRRKELAKMCHKPSTTSVQRNSASVTDEKTGPTKCVSASGDTKPADILGQLVSRLALIPEADNAGAAEGSHATPQGVLPDER